MNIDTTLTPHSLQPAVARVFELASQKVRLIDRTWQPSHGTPVFTVQGKYTTRGWTEWTQGFQYGSAILCFDATGEKDLLELGRSKTRQFMAPHVSHVAVHDHGFNNLSTYGNLRRLMREKKIPHDEWELAFYELAIKSSAAVQAARWSPIHDGGGYIYSFNGPHSLFVDTMRTIRILGLAHQLGHFLSIENDQKACLLDRLITHATATAKYNIFYGEGRDSYDVPALRGRTAHEAIFNRNDGRFRCTNSQQGYSPFSTWTRGLAWAILGFAEELEFLESLNDREFAGAGASAASAAFANSGKGNAAFVAHPPSFDSKALQILERAAMATADFYLDQAAASDGIPYWDTGAPELHKINDWQSRPAEPFNDYEPVDSSAAAIAAQGLLRLGKYLGDADDRYFKAGLNIARTLLAAPYLSESPEHQGLLLHSVYHRPNGWDFIPPGRKIPCGESSMWGDYHAIELAILLQRLADPKQVYYTFFDI